MLEAIGGLVTLPLYVGPDPSADPAADPTSAIHPDGGDLFVPDQLKWMVDFDAAVAAGHGASPSISRRAGAQRASTGCSCSGVQLAPATTDGAGRPGASCSPTTRCGRAGLSLVPQGTPTHNTTGDGAGYTRLDDADAELRRPPERAAVHADHRLRRRARRPVAGRGAGRRPGRVRHASTPAAARTRCSARAMQRALWPATLGYWMDKMLTPVFGDDDRRGHPLVLHQLRQRPRRGAGDAHRRPALRRPADHRVLPDRLARRQPCGRARPRARRWRSWPSCSRCCAMIDGGLDDDERPARATSASPATRIRCCSTSSACTRPRSSTTRATRRA